MDSDTTTDPRANIPDGPAADLRDISDVDTMRALSHPVRIALIETLTMFGAMTATQAGERIGESPTTCSFHLRQLAKYGFVEEAGGGKGRARPWRMATIGMRVKNVHVDPAAEIAAGALTRMVRERQLQRYQSWLESRPSYPQRWREVAGDGAFLFYVTPDELEALTEELVELLVPRYRERITDPASRPAGSVPVEMLLFTYPIGLPDTQA